MKLSLVYQLYVCDEGVIYNLDGTIKQTTASSSGYLTFSKDHKNILVQWAVADAWLGPKPNGYDVCHKDANRRNNRPDNLYYATRSQNLLDIWDLTGKARGRSRFLGVCFSEREGKWKAYYNLPGCKRQHLGTYLTETEAAHAVNRYLIENKIKRRLNPL